MPVRAVLLDVDDTLLNTREAMLDTIRDVLLAQFSRLSTARATRMAEHFHTDPGAFFRAYTRGELSFPVMRAARLEAACAAEGVSYRPARYEPFEAAYEAHFYDYLSVHDDTARLLTGLRRRRIPFGFLTNSASHTTTRKLTSTGLARYARPVVTADTLGVGKPNPRVFHFACELLRQSPGETAYLGDELDIDALGAHHAGLHGVWLDRRGRHTGEDVGVPVVRSLDEALPVLLTRSQHPMTRSANQRG